MLKSKKVTYVLILCVLLVWGWVFYRIYINYDSGHDIPAKMSINVKLRNQIHVNRNELMDSVTLLLNYPDPFRKELNATSRGQKIVAATPIPPIPPTTVPINWNIITYLGYVRNTVSKKNIALLSYNNNEFMLAEGEEEYGVKLLSISIDSIQIQYKNAKQYLKIKK